MYTDDSGIGIDDLEAEYSAESVAAYSPGTDGSIGGSVGGGGSVRLGNGTSAGGYDQHQHTYETHGVVHPIQHHQQHYRQSDVQEQQQLHQHQHQQYAQGVNMSMQHQVIQRPPYGIQQRVSSIDMGIGSIINRTPGNG